MSPDPEGGRHKNEQNYVLPFNIIPICSDKTDTKNSQSIILAFHDNIIKPLMKSTSSSCQPATICSIV